MSLTSPLEALGYPLFFPVGDADDLDLEAPAPRLDQAQRTRVRSLEGMQKEALVTSSLTGTTWRLASDEGPYLDGDDVAPCPLAFMTTGMVSAFANEVLALAEEVHDHLLAILVGEQELHPAGLDQVEAVGGVTLTEDGLSPLVGAGLGQAGQCVHFVAGEPGE